MRHSYYRFLSSTNGDERAVNPRLHLEVADALPIEFLQYLPNQ